MTSRPTIVTLHRALPGEGGAVPEWVHLVPAGRFSGADGRGPYVNEDPAAVIAASTLPMPLDEMHATDLGGSTLGMSAPARGWIVELEARADGIWGRVDWTGAGRELVADRAYRGISPALVVHKTSGVVLAVRRASLTNVPNLPLTTLHSQQGANMDLMTRLRALLGLDGDADDAAILTALEQVVGDRTMQSQQLGTLAGLAGLAATTKPGDIVTALQSRLTQAAGGAAQLQAQVTTLQSQLATIQAERQAEQATALIDAAIREGKPVPAPLKATLITLHAQDPAAVKATLDALPSLHSGGLKADKPPAADGAPAADEHIVALMGLDRAKYLEQKAAMGAAVEHA